MGNLPMKRLARLARRKEAIGFPADWFQREREGAEREGAAMVTLTLLRAQDWELVVLGVLARHLVLAASNLAQFRFENMPILWDVILRVVMALPYRWAGPFGRSPKLCL
jgi:hypothetical protein